MFIVSLTNCYGSEVARQTATDAADAATVAATLLTTNPVEDGLNIRFVEVADEPAAEPQLPI